MTAQNERLVNWRLFCPSCLTPFEGVEHRGTANLVHQARCERCRKRYTVVTGITAFGDPEAHSTPVFIKKPEVVADNAPVAIP